MLGGLADKVLLSFPDENRLFDPKKTVVTGNPVRMEIRELGERYVEPPSRLQTRRLLVAGGSQGARALNHAVVRALPGFKERGVEIRHQTGPLDFEEVRSTYADFGMNTESVTPFIEDMAAAYEWADLVLCRAGASTVAELAVAGKASVLVPFPHATHQHQLQNARHLEDAGAARIIVQNLLEDTDLAAMVGAMFGAEGMIRSMSRAARKMARPDAAERLADAVSELVEAKKRKKRRK
jgi:UDP-N-acetylglucosamine--N-acetylmuramyl-(pentapeptide) pyrophosphoryl-undecaprenol N-acetylglucosamine transferase